MGRELAARSTLLPRSNVTRGVAAPASASSTRLPIGRFAYTAAQIAAVQDDAIDPWHAGNAMLYDLCGQHPGHDAISGIVAKLWLIGKAYSAPLDRGRGKAKGPKLTSDRFYCESAAPRLRDSGLDRMMASLPSDAPLNAQLVPQALAVHGYLTGLFAELNGVPQRSLASKYLHFHRPLLFFIYDSRACEELDMLAPAKSQCVVPDGADPQYAAFLQRVLAFRDALEQAYDARLTPRHVDRLLLRRYPLEPSHDERPPTP